MKRAIGLFIILFIRMNYITAQVLCIQCFDQNAPISSSITNLILNGGFENGCGFNQYFCPNSNLYASNPCNLTNWTCSGGGTATYATCWIAGISMAAEGSYAAYFGNSDGRTCSLIQCDTTCLIDNGCTVLGIPNGFPISYPQYGGDSGLILEQTVSGLIIGNTYVLEFWAGGEDYPWLYDGLFAVDIGFGNIFMRDHPTSVDTSIGIGTRFIIQFNAVTTSHTFKFTNWGHICYNGLYTELVLDDVRLYSLSELNNTVPHCVLETNDIGNNISVSIFPNPTYSSFTLHCPESIVNSQLSIFNSLGQAVTQQFINSTNQQINLSPGAGVYFLRVRERVEKIIVY
jgi:hypothetical protein